MSQRLCFTSPPSGALNCSACSRWLPRGAFPKPQKGRGEDRQCRSCSQKVQCKSCNEKFAVSSIQSNCRSSSDILCPKCKDSFQFDTFLQTPKDELGRSCIWDAIFLQRKADFTALLTCYRFGIFEKSILQRIMCYARLPHMLSLGGMHYCELCNETFQEVSVPKRLRMRISHKKAEWDGCPGVQLKFTHGSAFDVSELRRVANGNWFFRTLVKRRADKNRGSENQAQFDAYWAPLSATIHESESNPVHNHIMQEKHLSLQTEVCSGSLCVVWRAASQLARRLGEHPRTSQSRFSDGLQITQTTCSPHEVEQAAFLQRNISLRRNSKHDSTENMWMNPAQIQDEPAETLGRRKKKGR